MNDAPVITGLGFITSIGNDRASVISALRHLHCGIEKWDAVPGTPVPVKVAGTLKGFDTSAPDSAGWTWPDRWEIDRTLLRGLAPQGLYAACAMEQAIAEARLTTADLADGTTGLFTASGGSPRMLHHHLNRLAASGWQRAHPLGVVSSVAGTLGFNFAAHYGITGSTCGFVSACASGSHALGFASDEIRLGRQECVIVLAAEDLTAETLLPFAGMGALSLNPDPATASRPFDAARDGFVGTGGAVAIVLESAQSARKRGAAAQSRLLGWGQAADGFHLAQPHPQGTGLLAAMRLCLRSSGIDAESLDYINAHAPSTPAGDRAEALALTALLGEHRPAVSSTKALTGHALSLSGLMEAAFCSLALSESLIPGQAALHTPDPAAATLHLPRQTVEKTPRHVLNNASGFGGANVCHLFAQ